MNDNMNLQNNQQQPPQTEYLYSSNVNVQISDNRGNKKFLGLLIPIVVLTVVLVGLASYYFICTNSPLVTYQSIIKETIKGVYDSIEVDDKFSASFGLDVNLDLEEDMLDEEILDLINDTKFNVGLQYDRKQEKVVAKVDSSIGKDSLLKANLYLNNKDEKLYVYAKEFLDKYIEIEDEDFSVFDILFKELTKEQQKDLNKTKKILTNELVKVISKEDVSKENGYHVLKITSEELAERLEQVIINLKNNKEFLDCFESEDTAISILDSVEITYGDDTEIKYMIKKSFFNKIEEIIVEIEETKVVIKINGNEISYEIKEDGSKVLDGTIEIKEEKYATEIKLVLDIPDFGSLTINATTSYTTKFDMDSINKSKVVSADDMTEADQNELMENLQESKLYELISSFDMDNNYDDDYEYDDNYENNNITDTENAITLYGNNERVYFNVPQGYKLVYSSNNYKTYEKGNIEVTIHANYGETANDYLMELNDKPSYYDEDYYQNVFLSSGYSLNVGSQTYFYKDFTYEYVGYSYVSKYYDKYLYTKINEEDSVVVKVSASDMEIPASDLNTFLTLSY